MLKRLFTTLFTASIAFTFIFPGLVAMAQTIDQPPTAEKELADEIYFVKANIPVPVITNRPSVFSASPQFDITKVQSIEYIWNFGDGNRDKGKEVVHTYNEPGNYTLGLETQITENNKNKVIVSESEQIFVAQKFALLISDRVDLQEKIGSFVKLAREENIALQLVESYNSQSTFLSEEVLAKKLNELNNLIQKTDTILVWTQTGTGLNALTRYLQTKPEASLQNTTIILLTDELTNLQSAKRQYQQIRPREIIVVRESGISLPFLESQNIEEYKQKLTKGGYDFEIINERSNEIKPWRILSYTLNFLTEKGIPDNTLILILLLPVIATVIAFLKQVVGLSTLGLYTPTIITLTFLILGIKFGVVILFFITIVSLVSHKILKKFRLLYVPKMAIVITIVSLTIFILFSLAVLWNILDAEFISFAIFPTVVMGTLVEKVVTANSTKSFGKSLLTILGVLVVSGIAYIIVGGPIDFLFINFRFDFIRNFIANYPEAIILFVIINTLLGRWTGLRLTEVIHFQEIMYNTEE
ncbi:hypothetical protein COV81_05065 [Candidatus Peregrinibacteria bacterium CG11_big_fil_rev_8_21_14_0_20_41_10]|nr:MAG: hypothetical protein COV81_05065 [Candidatus Peregrinibacteria bacterium CG11_big_fil_rev_8_21_14_0_20_41_10]PJC37699.1 MAG: hypothetical protein CO045_04380 [Candidatus Peregrinibacteria bacterium CG_4_9_14_0_2_um_filter_41_14]